MLKIVEIQNEILAEIERVFETKVNPMCVYAKAQKANKRGDVNTSPAENTETTGAEDGDIGDKKKKMTPAKIVEEVDGTLAPEILNGLIFELVQVWNPVSSLVGEMFLTYGGERLP